MGTFYGLVLVDTSSTDCKGTDTWRWPTLWRGEGKMKAEDDATEVRWLITDSNFMIRQTTRCWQTDEKFVWRLVKETATQSYSTGCSKITIMDVTVRHLEYIHGGSFDLSTSSSFLMGWEETSLDWLLPTFRCEVLPLSSWVKWTKWRRFLFG